MRDYVIMIILFSVVAGLGALVVSDVASSEHGYNISNMTDISFNSAYNQVEYTSGIAETMGNESLSDEGLSTAGGVELLYGSTKAVIQLVAGSFLVVRNVLSSMTLSLGIPLEVGNILFGAVISILIIIIVFVVISSLTKTKM